LTYFSSENQRGSAVGTAQEALKKKKLTYRMAKSKASSVRERRVRESGETAELSSFETGLPDDFGKKSPKM
jgi:hypothetical protein